MISRKPHKRKRFHNDWFEDWFEDDWSGAAFWGCKKEEDHCKKKKEDPCKKKKDKKKKEKRSIIIHAAAAAVIGNRSHKPVLQIDISCSPNSGCCLGFFIKISTK
ncbi:hypothetical protein M5C89_00215 [Bacillus velezensis]|nr:hypothetical protein M5C89_00215 [Bacillus velezensis]